MAACGITHEQIARCIGEHGIDPKTLRKHFADELDTASIKATASIANLLYQRAMKGDLTAMIFWLKCQAGWRERQEIAHTGKDGAPLIPLAAIDTLIRNAGENDEES